MKSLTSEHCYDVTSSSGECQSLMSSLCTVNLNAFFMQWWSLWECAMTIKVLLNKTFLVMLFRFMFWKDFSGSDKDKEEKGSNNNISYYFINAHSFHSPHLSYVFCIVRFVFF